MTMTTNPTEPGAMPEVVSDMFASCRINNHSANDEETNDVVMLGQTREVVAYIESMQSALAALRAEVEALRGDACVVPKLRRRTMQDPTLPPEVSNCMASCFASVSEDGEVREFPLASGWFEAAQQYWAQRGWLLAEVQQDVAKGVPRGLWFAYGRTSRSAKFTHLVVMEDEQMIHDPHASGAGLVAIESRWVLLPWTHVLAQHAARAPKPEAGNG